MLGRFFLCMLELPDRVVRTNLLSLANTISERITKERRTDRRERRGENGGGRTEENGVERENGRENGVERENGREKTGERKRERENGREC